MKRVISLIAIASMLSLTGFAKGPVAKGKTNCCLGNYVIEKATDPIMVDGNALKSFVVYYENSDMTVTIGIDNTSKRCTRYIVKSEKLNVQYDCNKKYFGVNRVEKYYEKSGITTDNQMLNREEYFHQKVLSRQKRSEIDQVKLISVFYPRLVKDYEKVFAVK